MFISRLLVLLAVTVEASRHDLGHWNIAVTLMIAVSKAVLIALVFMHVWRSPALLKLVVVASLGWLAIMFSLTMADYSTRSWDLSIDRQPDNFPDGLMLSPDVATETQLFSRSARFFQQAGDRYPINSDGSIGFSRCS